MRTTDWQQYTVTFIDRDVAEQVAAHDLHPALVAAQDAALLHGWWYLRKKLTWRLRYRSTTDAESTMLGDLLDALADEATDQPEEAATLRIDDPPGERRHARGVAWRRA